MVDINIKKREGSILKINLIISSFYPAVIYGGPIFSTLYACKELVKLDDIEIYVSTTNTNMTKRLDVKTNKFLDFSTNLYVKYYNETIIGKFSTMLLLNIFKDIKKNDVVHIQGIFNTPIPVSLLSARLQKKPVILSSRGSLGNWVMSQGNRFKKIWLKLFIKPFSEYVTWHATAQQEKDEILSHFPNAKVTLIPNGTYIEEYNKINNFKPTEFIRRYTSREIDKIDKIIVSMGRLQKKKGFDILIESFNSVLRKFPNSYLFIAGPDEGEGDNLNNQITEYNLEEKVFLIGNIENQEKINFLGNADLFALPSHNENFGNVYLESLASGTPIIASKNTPWKEVEEYNCGKWVDNSVEETSKAMLEILKKDRNIMRENSMKLAAQYDWSEIALKFSKLYRELIH